MTVSSKLKINKEAADPSAAEKEDAPSTKPAVVTRREFQAVVMLKTSPRRLRLQRSRMAAARANINFVIFMSVLIVIDVYSMLHVDTSCSSHFVRLTGLFPAFNIFMLLVFHLMTLFGGLSQTVKGTILAVSIALLTVAFSFIFLVVFPSFVGSYNGSGVYEATRNSSNYSETAKKRFHDGFHLAIGSQILVIAIFLASFYQYNLTTKLFVEAQKFEAAINAQERAFQESDRATGAGEAFIRTQ